MRSGSRPRISHTVRVYAIFHRERSRLGARLPRSPQNSAGPLALTDDRGGPDPPCTETLHRNLQTKPPALHSAPSPSQRAGCGHIVRVPPSTDCRRPSAMLLPASTLAAINNVVALHLEPDTTMKVLGAILAPVLSSDSTPARKVGRPGPKPRKATRPRKRRRPTSEARDRAPAALQANPN